MIRTILRESDNIVSVTGVENELNGELVSNASVWVSIFDTDGNNVEGTVWPITLDPVQGSPGDYRGLIPDTAELEVGKLYTARVSIDDGPSRKITEEHELEILKRR